MGCSCNHSRKPTKTGCVQRITCCCRLHERYVNKASTRRYPNAYTYRTALDFVFCWAGRSAGSMCWCIVGAVLSTIVFGYTVKGSVDGLKDGSEGLCSFFLLLLMLLLWWLSPTIIAVWTGVYHCLCTSKVQTAVETIKAANAREAEGVRNDGQMAPVGLDGVDLFEYHDVTSMSSNMTKLGIVWVLSQVLTIPLFIVFLGLALSTCEMGFLAFNSCPVYLIPLDCFISALFLGCVARALFKSGIVKKILDVGKPCQTMPFSTVFCHVWTVVWVGSLVVYNAFTFVSPAPVMWRWGAILMHTTRTVKVLYSLPRITNNIGR